MIAAVNSASTADAEHTWQDSSLGVEVGVSTASCASLEDGGQYRSLALTESTLPSQDQKRWKPLFAALLVVALVTALLVMAKSAAARLLRPSSVPGGHSSLGWVESSGSAAMTIRLHDTGLGHEWHCGLIEDGVDYEIEHAPFDKVHHVATAADCQNKCFRDGACMLWTWMKPDSEDETSRSVCLLKRLDQGERPIRKQSRGMVSGSLPCYMEYARPALSLFCFALMQPDTYEKDLLAAEAKTHSSIFACEEYSIFSNQVRWIAPGVFTTHLEKNLTCDKGGEFGTALNLDVFMEVWTKVFKENKFMRHNFTVKVDPDTVFLPHRLKAVLPHYRERPGGVYLNNCRFGLHGPLEVFSTNAVLSWTQGRQRCVDHFNKVCSGPCNWGEDMFIDQCLWKVLNVSRYSEWTLLSEDHCKVGKASSDWKHCANGNIAFHPFKTTTAFENCKRHAEPGNKASLVELGNEATSARSGGDFELNYQASCPLPENDIDYDIKGLSRRSLDHIPNPEMCCAFCHGIPDCRAWVWKHNHSMSGCPFQCWVLDYAPVRVDAMKHQGAVSGTPPPRLPHNKEELQQDVATLEQDGGTQSVHLFCFALMMPHGYELSLLSLQRDLRTGIFACDDFAVYSNVSLEVAPGLRTHVVHSDLTCDKGGDSYTALNSWIFIAVWKEVIADGAYKKADWIVKVDVDAVFLPERLPAVLVDHKDAAYINNCRFGMHGPIEVLARRAVDALAEDYARSEKGDRPERCVKGLHFGLWGEDMFLDQCLSKVHGLSGALDNRVLCEANCECPNWFWCSNGTGRVSYHPFKREDMFQQCLANAIHSGTRLTE